MIYRLLLSLTLFTVLPVSAATLSFTDVTDRYLDAPFSHADAAGISVLTSLGAVQGNPDGTFAPGRSLNRAEFLKIATRSASLLDIAPAVCFPDVAVNDWFSAFVCSAKEHGIVQGYPDGLFHPERQVNYAEALKILYELHWGDQHSLTPDADEQWYVPYRDVAYESGVGLQGMEEQMARQLTRGQMARLAAAYRAHAEGQLDAYRAFEQGISVNTSSASSLSSLFSLLSLSSLSSSSSSSLTSSASFSSLASSSVSLPPSVSRFLLLGERSPVLLDGVFLSSDQDGEVTEVTVAFARKHLSFADLVLVDGADREIVVLTPRTSGTDEEQDKEWRGAITEGKLQLRKGQPLRLGVRAHVKSATNGGLSNEMVEAKDFELRVQGAANGSTMFLHASDVHFPVHQTALGRITGMENVLATSMSMQQGTKKTLASFALSATGSAARMQGFTFLLEARDTAVTNIWIGGQMESQQTNCGLTAQGGQTLISCPLLPEAFRVLNGGSLTLSLFGDLMLTGSATAGFVQVRPLGHGTVTTEGVLRWTDGVGEFTWMEADVPVDIGPMVTVTR